MQLSTWLVTGVAAILLLELVIYLSGIVDSPRFDVDARIGYVPKPNQSGSFLHRNKWAFNDLRMGVSQPFRPMPDRVDLLLVGDSIVFGGNPYRPEQKLGASIERHSDWRVWPIGSGSWALQNELTYLAENPAAWQQVDRIVFVLNSGDFDEPSSWQTDLQHPRRYPWLATWYLVRRYLLNEQLPDPPMPVAAWPDLACRFEVSSLVPASLWTSSSIPRALNWRRAVRVKFRRHSRKWAAGTVSAGTHDGAFPTISTRSTRGRSRSTRSDGSLSGYYRIKADACERRRASFHRRTAA